jgi:hypothetical protein
MLYDGLMRRLLQFATLFFILATVLTPLVEYFDRWDSPGISNDTEFAVFLLIFVLCLVLLVSKLVSALALLVNLVSVPYFQRSDGSGAVGVNCPLEIFVPPLSSPPLRI